jgi:small subunit ribosomal protein S2
MGGLCVAIVQVKELIEAGVHFGHRASRWNPKMRPYIYGKRNLIHIIDLRETLRGLLRASKYLVQIASQNKTILFVGTKRQAKETVEREAQRCGMPFVSERWLGGTLTNFRTIRSRLQRLQELEGLEETGQIHTFSKKMISTLTRERKKIYRNLQGIREMNRLPEALVVIDPHREHIAVKEAKKMGIATVALIDTDSDPDLVDLPIPGNDDSIRSIELVLTRLSQAVLEGRAAIPPELLAKSEPQTGGGDQRRGRRVPREERPSSPAATTPAEPAPVAAVQPS